MWVISKNGKQKRKRSPRKVFTETEMYTIKMSSGERHLIIEDTLSRIEDAFARIIKEKVKKGLALTEVERANLCIFVAAMSARTMKQKRHFTRTFADLREMTEQMEKHHNSPPTTSLEIGAVEKIAQQVVLSEVLESMPPILYRMSSAIFVADDDIGFITSDAPCVWFNPELRNFPPLFRHPGLAQEKIEVTLPLTPQYLLLYSWSELKGYLPAPAQIVDELNRRIRAHCDVSFISRKSETRPIWFEMKRDAWGSTEPKE